ncbi:MULTISPECIES: FixH family protein [unclassified Undibacterium]|uniref:FixH family protein n=1 Tax=unclassified Undibacterium TaxID=2630295 RepID=UPI002AC924EE|nr:MULTISPECIES: FixH family protein [unclassified Undibacterium]MEB0139345.1 FixH family protein [Undibacterium sp. CCC2.1]MEB0172189.1 FixH family protein [Undibacterium sp. CCC1.1]MEB0176021.1 FixH family protein [Undibacterium sp. CCC3.4]WPX43409.1 FixH family protein [Undibacterium sp. CCC3.4]
MEAVLIPKKIDKWYKEPWLLLVVGGPAIVVCASIFTGVLAYLGSDKVVAEDYYKQGLMINTDIRRDAKARELQLAANLTLDMNAGKIRLQLRGQGVLPQTLQLSLANAAEDGSSVNEVIRRLPMKLISDGRYEGDIKLASNISSSAVKLFHIKLETSDWRLTGDWYEPTQKPAALSAAR